MSDHLGEFGSYLPGSLVLAALLVTVVVLQGGAAIASATPQAALYSAGATWTIASE